MGVRSLTLKDKLDRPLKDIRISVTDRCNFRCFFCMPPDKDIQFLDRKELLTYEEIAKLVKILSQLGVRKVRITGGEPLMRAHLENLIALLSDIEGIKDIALTTNGYKLAQKVKDLKDAGLKRITVSLITLRQERFVSMIGRNVDLGEIIEGIEEAKEVGLEPVKINTVVVKGVNDDEIIDITEFCRERGLVLRFIEFMDVGTLNGWNMEKVVSAEEILNILSRKYPVEELPKKAESETSLRFKFKDINLEFGIIASVTKPFCRGCTRLRLSADGKFYTCLFSSVGHDVKSLLRGGASEEDIKAFVENLWLNREDRYSELRTQEGVKNLPKVEMFRVGG